MRFFAAGGARRVAGVAFRPLADFERDDEEARVLFRAFEDVDLARDAVAPLTMID